MLIPIVLVPLAAAGGIAVGVFIADPKRRIKELRVTLGVRDAVKPDEEISSEVPVKVMNRGADVIEITSSPEE